MIEMMNRMATLQPDLLDPQQLRDDAVAQDQRPVHVPVRTGGPVVDHVLLELVGAVPGEERLHHVAVEHDQAGDEHDLRHVVEMAHRDHVLQAVDAAHRDEQRQHHREAGVDGAGDEVGREDRGVPAGQQRHREVEAHDGVDREHQRRREAGEDQVGGLVDLPVPRRAAPAHGQHAVDELRRSWCGARSRIVARSGIRPVNQKSAETVP